MEHENNAPITHNYGNQVDRMPESYVSNYLGEGYASPSYILPSYVNIPNNNYTIQNAHNPHIQASDIKNSQNPSEQRFENGIGEKNGVYSDSVRNSEDGFNNIGKSFDYCQNDQGMYYRDKDGNLRRFTDFFLRNIFVEIHCYRTNESESIFNLVITNDLRYTAVIKINATRWGDLPKEIERQAPLFQIFEDICPNVRQKFIRATKEFFKKRMANQLVRQQFIHHYWGWGVRHGNRREFFDGSRSDCVSEKKLCPLMAHNQYWHQIMIKGLRIFEIGFKEVMYPMVIYCLTSYMDAVFTDAGYPLEHCQMIVGASGNKKTSLVKVIFNPFVPENEKVHTVRSTSAAMNILHQICYDDTLVIDDLNFEGTVAEIEAKKKNFRDLIRTYSDKTPRAKYGGENTVKKNLVRGGCVFTAESNLTGQLASSEYRYIKVHVDKSIDNQKLQEFQSNPYLWQQIVSEWIRYISNDYASLVSQIKEVFPKRRANVQIKESRLVDAFVHLQITAEIFTSMLLNMKLIDQDERLQFCKDFMDIMTNLIAKQSVDATKQIAHIMYLSEFWNLVGTSEIKIAPSIDQYIMRIKYFAGYKEHGIIMLKRDKVYETIIKAFKARNEFFPHSVDEVSKMLKDHGLTITEKNETLKRASGRIAGRPRMLALIESKCLDLMEQISG